MADKAHAGGGAGTSSQHLTDPVASVDGRRRQPAPGNGVRERKPQRRASSTATAKPARDREHAYAAGPRHRHAAAGCPGQRLQSRLGNLQFALRSIGDRGDERAQHTDGARRLRARRRSSAREGNYRLRTSDSCFSKVRVEGTA